MTTAADTEFIEFNEHTRANTKLVEKVREEVRALRQDSDKSEGGCYGNCRSKGIPMPVDCDYRGNRVVCPAALP